jgi:hypothetical protein
MEQLISYNLYSSTLGPITEQIPWWSLNYTTSFHLLSNLLFINYPIIVWTADSIVK